MNEFGDRNSARINGGKPIGLGEGAKAGMAEPDAE